MMAVEKDELAVVEEYQVIVVFGFAVSVEAVVVYFDTAIELVDDKGVVVIAFAAEADNVAVAHDDAVAVAAAADVVVDWRIWVD